MLYVESRKSFKVRREKKLISLPSAKGKHSVNLLLCRVPLTDTQQSSNGWHTNWRMSTWRFFAVCLCFTDCFFLVCRVFFRSLPSCLFSALDKEFGMPSAIILPNMVSAALGKQLFLPSVRRNALSKYFGTRQILVVTCYTLLNFNN